MASRKTKKMLTSEITILENRQQCQMEVIEHVVNCLTAAGVAEKDAPNSPEESRLLRHIDTKDRPKLKTLLSLLRGLAVTDATEENAIASTGKNDERVGTIEKDPVALPANGHIPVALVDDESHLKAMKSDAQKNMEKAVIGSYGEQLTKGLFPMVSSPKTTYEKLVYSFAMIAAYGLRIIPLPIIFCPEEVTSKSCQKFELSLCNLGYPRFAQYFSSVGVISEDETGKVHLAISKDNLKKNTKVRDFALFTFLLNGYKCPHIFLPIVSVWNVVEMAELETIGNNLYRQKITNKLGQPFTVQFLLNGAEAIADGEKEEDKKKTKEIIKKFKEKQGLYSAALPLQFCATIQLVRNGNEPIVLTARVVNEHGYIAKAQKTLVAIDADN